MKRDTELDHYIKRDIEQEHLLKRDDIEIQSRSLVICHSPVTQAELYFQSAIHTFRNPLQFTRC